MANCHLGVVLIHAILFDGSENVEAVFSQFGEFGLQIGLVELSEVLSKSLHVLVRVSLLSDVSLIECLLLYLVRLALSSSSRAPAHNFPCHFTQGPQRYPMTGPLRLRPGPGSQQVFLKA